MISDGTQQKSFKAEVWSTDSNSYHIKTYKTMIPHSDDKATFNKILTGDDYVIMYGNQNCIVDYLAAFDRDDDQGKYSNSS